MYPPPPQLYVPCGMWFGLIRIEVECRIDVRVMAWEGPEEALDRLLVETEGAEAPVARLLAVPQCRKCLVGYD